MADRRLISIRCGFYSIATTASLGTFVTGTIAARSSAWEKPFIGFYIAWTCAFGIFILSFAGNSKDFTLRCLYYLMCSGATLLFFSTVGNMNADVIHLYIPVCTCIGVFVGVAMKQGLSLLTWARIRARVVRFLLPDDRRQGLPQYEQERTHNQPMRTISGPTRPSMYATLGMANTTEPAGRNIRCDDFRDSSRGFGTF